METPLKTRDVIELWPGGAGPGSEQSLREFAIAERSNIPFWPDRIATGISKPDLTAFVPDKPNGTAVIVAPGGGYKCIVLDKEAAEMARWLNPLGVTVLVMQYRLPGEGHVNGPDVPLMDAQRAIRVVRKNAKRWGLALDKIGFLGASAGGRMGAMLGAQFDREVYQPVDEADRFSARPDFLILLYPVVSMDDKYTHMESRDNLIGENPADDQIRTYSADQHVSRKSAETFIVMAENDSVVSPENGMLYHQALKVAGVPTVLHTFKKGGHGFGIRDTRQLPVSIWPSLAADWLRASGYITD